MAKRKKKARVEDYRHDEKRKNNPPIGMVSYESKVGEPKMKYYSCIFDLPTLLRYPDLGLWVQNEGRGRSRSTSFV